MQVTSVQAAWLSLTCQRTAGVGSVCRKSWLQPAVSSNISSAVPPCIKAEKNQHKTNFSEWLRLTFAECRAFSLVTTPTQKHTSKNWCSLLFENQSQAPQRGWIFLDLLPVCLVVSGHRAAPHCSLPKHWWEKPWDSS